MIDDGGKRRDPFSAFVAELQVTPDEIRAAGAACDDVADRLDSCFGAPVAGRERFRLIGSFANRTAIRPGRRVDMLYVLPDRLRADGRPPAAAIAHIAADVRGALADGFALGQAGPPFWLSAEVPDGVGVNLAPCFRSAAGQYIVPPLHPGEEWRTLDPGADTARLWEANQASAGRAAWLIMVLKAWRRTRGVPIRPFALQLLVCDFVLDRRTEPEPLVDMIGAFFAWASHQRAHAILAPITFETVPLGTEWRRQAEAAAELFTMAERLDHSGLTAPAAYRWQQLFGPRFQASALREAAEALPARVFHGLHVTSAWGRTGPRRRA